MKNKNRAFSLVELIIVIAIITILTGMAYLGYSSYSGFMKNKRVTNDLTAISHAMSQYYRDHDSRYPVPSPEENPTMNLLCLNADLTSAHNCATAAIITGMIDESLLTRRYLSEIPRDPRTGARYVYAVTGNGRYWQVAAVTEDGEGGWIAVTKGNLKENFFLPGLIRAYDSPRFVVNGGTDLPYSPDPLSLSARLRNIEGAVSVSDKNGEEKSMDDTLYPGDTVTTAADSSADIFFSDGSVTHLDPDTGLVITGESAVTENEEDSIVTKIYLKLIRGKIWNKVVRLAEKSEFDVETTSAIAGVRGTEFGVWDDNTLIVYSGTVWVKEDTDEKIVSGSPDAPARATISADGPEGITEVTDTSLLDYITEHHVSRVLTEAAVPFITGLAGGSSGASPMLYVSFNFRTTEDVYDVNGFEVFAVSGTMNAWTDRGLTEGEPLADITDEIKYLPTRKAYTLRMDFTVPPQEDSGLPAGMFVIRAYTVLPDGGRSYSALSWRPWGIVGTPDTGYKDVNDDLNFPLFPDLVSITISGPDEIVSDGTTNYAYTAEGKYDDLSVKDLTYTCGWEIGDVATGTLIPYASGSSFRPPSAGTYTLTCDLNNVTGEKTVTATDAVPLTVTNLTQVTGPTGLAPGGSYDYTVLGELSDGDTTADVTSYCEQWSVTPTNAGTVVNGGLTVATGFTGTSLTITCSIPSVSLSVTSDPLTVIPAVPTLADVCTTANGGYYDGTSCWVMGEAGVSCDTACTNFGTTNDVTAAVSCNPDTTWNDCGTDGTCGEDAPEGDDGSICLALTSGDYPETGINTTYTTKNFAPYWVDDGTAQKCSLRNPSASVSCSATPTVSSFRRLCSCTE